MIRVARISETLAGVYTTEAMRPNQRSADATRSCTFEPGFVRNAAGSVLVRCGATTVVCTCCVEKAVPDFLLGKGKGWLTAEYGMLPGSTGGRKARDKAGKVDGRTVEIQRLIGRSLRAIVNLDRLGERTLWLDCDVIEADGGTRTTAINGAFVALCHAQRRLRQRSIELWQIEAGVAAWVVEEVRPDDLRNPSIVCKQTLADGAEVTVVWAFIPEDGQALLVTVYFPD